MSQCRKNGGLNTLSKYLLISSVGMFLLCLSAKAIAQAPPDDPRLSHDRPQPPEHPKPPSLKKMFSKINIFKKNKDSAPDNGNKNTPSPATTASTGSNKKPEPAATATETQPVGIKPTTNATANTTPTVNPMGKPVPVKKKTKKTTKPATSTKTTTTAPVI